MEFDDLNYLIETPCYVSKRTFNKSLLSTEDSKLLYRPHDAIFKEHMKAHDINYQRYILDFDQTQNEEVPLLVSFFDSEPRS